MTKMKTKTTTKVFDIFFEVYLKEKKRTCIFPSNKRRTRSHYFEEFNSLQLGGACGCILYLLMINNKTLIEFGFRMI